MCALVSGIVSDRQLLMRAAGAVVFPDVPHQLCRFHYMGEADRMPKMNHEPARRTAYKL